MYTFFLHSFRIRTNTQTHRHTNTHEPKYIELFSFLPRRHLLHIRKWNKNYALLRRSLVKQALSWFFWAIVFDRFAYFLPSNIHNPVQSFWWFKLFLNSVHFAFEFFSCVLKVWKVVTPDFYNKLFLSLLIIFNETFNWCLDFVCKYVECCLNPTTIKDDWPKIMSGKISSIKRRDQNASSSSNSSLSSSGGGDATMSADLASFFECPVCFDYVLPPILQCQSGHLVCSSCRSKLTCCPTCRGSLGNIRNLAMEKVCIQCWLFVKHYSLHFVSVCSRSTHLGCI